VTPTTNARYTDEERAVKLKKIPLHSFGEPRDIANAVVFLADNEKARYIVGQVLLSNLYYEEIHGETEGAITFEELEAYYSEHKDDLDQFEYSYLQFVPETVSATDDNDNQRTEEEIAALKQEAKDAAKAKAEATLEQYNAGVSIADLIEAGDPSASADHTVVNGSSSINLNFRDKMLELGLNEAALVEHETAGYYVIVFHSRSRNEGLTQADVRHILIRAETTTDDGGNVVAPSDEAWAKAKADAEAALAEYESGAKTAEAFGELANKYSDDTGSNTNGGLYEDVTAGRFVTEFNEWLFGDDQPEVGQTGLVRHEGDVKSSSAYWGYHVTYLENWGTTEWELAAKNAVLSEKMTEWNEKLVESGYETALASGANYLGN